MPINFTSGNNKNNSGSTSGNGIPIPTAPLPTKNTSADDDGKEFLINYNEKFKTASTALFREEVVCQTMACLIGKDKPNALLIGPAGVGKTKIAEDIAYRIENDDPLLPDKLKEQTIYELPLSNIIAGSGIVGQIEEKIKAVVDFASNKKNKAILFIDEIHMIIDGGEFYQKIGQILKPALARGEIRLIGATTSQEVISLTKDPAFNRRFSKVIVDELTKEQTAEILNAIKARYFMHYNNKVIVPADLIPQIVTIADQYKTAGSHRPDNAITLFDRACADTIITRKKQEREYQNDPNILSALHSVPILTVTEEQLRRTAIRMMSGTAKQDVVEKDALIEKLKFIKGQQSVIDNIVNLIVKKQKSYFVKNTPLTLLFAGTSGVGKTEVTNVIAETLTGIKPITLNMAEYHSSASINRIIGAPAGYIGSDSKAELPFDILETNPYQVILLDEFEKCDRAVQRLFMSAFDMGYITTARGSVVDFSKSIIIATTNAGCTSQQTNTLGFANKPASTEKNIDIKTLSNYFDTELLNRFHTIFTFQEISKETYKEILAEIYEKEVKRLKSEYRSIKIADTLTDAELNEISDETFVKEFGARPARRAVEKYIEMKI